MSVKRMLFVGFSISIIFVQEQLLLFLPNIQFTVLLLILFSSVMERRESYMMVIGYVVLDSLYMGALNPFTMLPLLLAWSFIPLFVHFFHKFVDGNEIHEHKLALFALVFGFLFGWIHIPFYMLQTGISNPLPYLVADIPFEIIMATSGYLTVLWLYKPLKTILNHQYIDSKLKESKL